VSRRRPWHSPVQRYLRLTGSMRRLVAWRAREREKPEPHPRSGQPAAYALQMMRHLEEVLWDRLSERQRMCVSANTYRYLLARRNE
jgi:hypothetical protein